MLVGWMTVIGAVHPTCCQDSLCGALAECRLDVGDAPDIEAERVERMLMPTEGTSCALAE